MADLIETIANMDAFQYQVFWKTEHVGLVKDVDASALKAKMLEQKIGQWNNIKIDDWYRGGIEGAVSITIHEVKVARMRKLMPWAGASGSFSIAPTAVMFSKYGNSGLLRLHPVGAADAADDIVLLHAFPMITLPKSAGEDWRELPSSWDIYPDRTALTDTVPTIVYGYIGDPPA